MADSKDFILLSDLDADERRNRITLDIPDSISKNLNSRYTVREYQRRTFARFIFGLENGYYSEPCQLLFQMATGSGKTLIMAGCILYLYEKGYRNFIYFVNSTNVIRKTQDNFLNKASIKYLFNEVVQFGDKQVLIKEVDNFQGVNTEDINIHFTTMQGLHSRMNNPMENSVTYEDFENQKVVLLSDEAHHINVDTKRYAGKQLNISEFEEYDSWERTVMRIFRSNKANILLEFTATAGLGDYAIAEKYKDKLVFDYSLKRFYLDKYSKEVKVLQAKLDTIARALQAIVLSQFRLKVFADNNLLIKPVVMFKSNYVNIPKKRDENTVVSSEFKESFLEKIRHLSVDDLSQIRNNAKEDSAIYKAFEYFQDSGTSLENLVFQLKEAFAEEKCISVDSISEKEQSQIIVNTLEEQDNQIRAVFAVEALNEGWDVLNLYDIVRLYDTRDAKGGIPGKTTMSEAQLIGRGARYCPFKLNDFQTVDQRKYDDDLNHPLRICEELYYHSSHNLRYVQELNKALDTIGIKPLNIVERPLKLKESFKETSFYKTGILYVNESVENKHEDVYALPEWIRNKVFEFSLKTGFVTETRLIADKIEQELEYTESDKRPLISFGIPVIRKAIQRLPFYNFTNIERKYPHLKSITEFITSDNYLANIQIELRGTRERLKDVSPRQRLEFAIEVLNKISVDIDKGTADKFGSELFIPQPIRETFTDDKILNLTLSEGDDAEKGYSMKEPKLTEHYLDLSKEEWYAYQENYGTSEEKKFVLFVKATCEELKNKYREVYLIRNERFFKLHRFSDAKVIEPDFVLFLTEKDSDKRIVYQLFIEPKGSHLLEDEAWKEEFLQEIEQRSQMNVIHENLEYKLIGLPFYNKSEREQIFKDAFERFKSGLSP